MKLVKLLANLGYGSRKDVTRLIRNGWLTRRDGSAVGLDDDYTHDDLLVGGKAAGDKEEVDYTTARYHQPADEWQAGWSFEGMTRDLQILYTLGRDLANSNDWPNWSLDSEFRGARDQSASERKGD